VRLSEVSTRQLKVLQAQVVAIEALRPDTKNTVGVPDPQRPRGPPKPGDRGVTPLERPGKISGCIYETQHIGTFAPNVNVVTSPKVSSFRQRVGQARLAKVLFGFVEQASCGHRIRYYLGPGVSGKK
jgi:hypothetical protein